MPRTRLGSGEFGLTFFVMAPREFHSLPPREFRSLPREFHSLPREFYSLPRVFHSLPLVLPLRTSAPQPPPQDEHGGHATALWYNHGCPQHAACAPSQVRNWRGPT